MNAAACSMNAAACTINAAACSINAAELIAFDPTSKHWDCGMIGSIANQRINSKLMLEYSTLQRLDK